MRTDNLYPKTHNKLNLEISNTTAFISHYLSINTQINITSNSFTKYSRTVVFWWAYRPHFNKPPPGVKFGKRSTQRSNKRCIKVTWGLKAWSERCKFIPAVPILFRILSTCYKAGYSIRNYEKSNLTNILVCGNTSTDVDLYLSISLSISPSNEQAVLTNQLIVWLFIKQKKMKVVKREWICRWKRLTIELIN